MNKLYFIYTRSFRALRTPHFQPLQGACTTDAPRGPLGPNNAMGPCKIGTFEVVKNVIDKLKGWYCGQMI